MEILNIYTTLKETELIVKILSTRKLMLEKQFIITMMLTELQVLYIKTTSITMQRI